MSKKKSFKVKGGRFRLDKRKFFFTVEMMRHWHRELAAAPSLKTFRVRLDGTLNKLI